MDDPVTPPLVLAIESATAHVGCAIGSSDGVIAAAYSARGRRHAESLAPQIGFVAEQAGVTLRDLDLIAVDVGPGLYTGLRVGITTARALAHTLGVRMRAVTSLDAIAHATGASDDFVVAIDARRGEVFHARYRRGADGRLVGEAPAVSSPGALAAALADDLSVPVSGDGAAVHAEEFRRAGLVIGEGPLHPGPEAVLALAAVATEPPVSEREIVPCYLRRPDAVAKWEARTGGVGP